MQQKLSKFGEFPKIVKKKKRKTGGLRVVIGSDCG